ncbi:MAG TPA: amidohydrolase family protein [Gemmatimonadaceae bacterium]|nr:amidohydrolase family protein [Gemmatimonadaceae bacterium]
MLTSLRAGAIAALLAAAASPPASLAAQATPRSVPETYAITNARVVPGSGPAIARGTVVIRNGLIAAVGADVTAPADARVVDGTGLTVYPGLVDAYSSLGIPAPEAPNGNGGGRGGAAPAPSGPQPGADADHPWGITPDVLAVDLMRVDAQTFDGPRSAGITTALSAPAEGYLRGRAALVDLSDENLSDAVVRSPAAMTMAFERGGRGGGPGFGRGGYPGSLMGIFAAFRQEVLDAQRYGTWSAMYAKNPRGVERPAMDAGLEAMQPVVAGQMPVIFEANSAREIDRAIKLAREFKLNGVIAGGEEADQCIPELKASGIPVLLSLDFPRRAASDTEPQLLSMLEERVNAPRVAGKLAAAGVAFAFTSGSMKNWSDFLDNAGKAVAEGLSPEAALTALTMAPARIFGAERQLGSIEAGKIANLTVTRGDLFAGGTKVETLFIDGRMITPSAPVTVAAAPASTAPAEPAPAAHHHNPVLIRNATILTVTKGTLQNADLLMENGKIAKIGKNLSAPSDATIVDGTGKYVMPGIIDPHSHSMIDAVNEGTLSVTSMVNMIDVLDPTSPAIYRELAGGVTTINVLHGSANTIGGQTVTVKLRRGYPADSMIFPGALPGIKFALGENVTRKNFPAQPGQERRYPFTRMGQEEVMNDAFTRALDYKARWDAYRAAVAKGATNLVPPRKNLELDPLVQVLEHKRIVNTHSYRSDEMLMMANLAKRFGFHVLFQHGLEGYKIASELAADGDMLSTFEDSWGYKVEAEDAIPYNVAILMRHGVVTTINSDDDGRARRLNVDAAKEMRYGGLTEDEALKTITYNGAVQLGVQDRVGSLEAGKDADVAIWDADPLSVSAKVLQTYVDGEKLFDRQEDLARRDSVAALKAQLEQAPENQLPPARPHGRGASQRNGGVR